MTNNHHKLTTGQIKRLYANLHKANLSREELSSIVSENTKKISAFLEPACPWSYWYDIPFNHLLLIFFTCAGMIEDIIRICKSGNADSQLLDYLDSDPDIDTEIEELYTDEEKAIVASLGVAIFNQSLAISIFGENINSMIKSAKEGNDNALFDAVLVDRSVISTPSVAKRIQIAQLTKDEPFFNLLSKAITRTRPRRPVADYDDARFMITALDECKSFSSNSNVELYKLIANELELYPTSGEDSFKAFEKFLQRLRKNQTDT